MKQNSVLVFGLVIAVCVGAMMLSASWVLAVIKTEMRMNVEYSEQIDHLLKVLVYRLERGDDIYADVKWMSANYHLSNGRQNLPFLMRTLLEKNTPVSRMKYGVMDASQAIRIYSPDEIDKSFWCLQSADQPQPLK